MMHAAPPLSLSVGTLPPQQLLQPQSGNATPEKGPRPASAAAATAALLCCAYMGVSSLLIVVNRNIMKKDKFKYPMTLSGMGLSAFAGVACLLQYFGKVVLRPDSRAAVAGDFWWKRVLPVALCKAATLAFSNWAYLYLNLGLIQMLKAFTPAIILGVASGLGVEKPPTKIVFSVGVICFGTLLTTGTDPSANTLGLLLQLGAMVTEAIAVVLTQKLLQSHKFGVWEGGIVLAPPGAAALMFTAALFEWGPMWRGGGVETLRVHPLEFLLAAFVGVGVNYLSYAVIAATSSLTFKVVTTMRNIGLVIFGVVVFGEVVRAAEVLGFSVTLAGFAWYNVLKMAPKPTPTLVTSHRGMENHVAVTLPISPDKRSPV